MAPGFKKAKKRTVEGDIESEVPSELAMKLALAYYVERCVEDGKLESYADAARQLGITRVRMTYDVD